EYMHEVYMMLQKDIFFLLSENCHAEITLPSDFDAALTSDNLIYVSYHTPLPSILIYLQTIQSGDKALTTQYGALTNSSRIRELVILPGRENINDVFAFSRLITGEVIKYKVLNMPLEELSRSDDFDIYRKASAMSSAEFAGTGNGSILSSSIIYTMSDSSYRININNNFGDVIKSTALQSELAETLNINLDKTGSYFDEEINGTVYMATHGTLVFTENKITYSTENNSSGVSLSHYSGKAGDESHTMYELLAIAESIVHSLKGKSSVSYILGGEAEPIVTSVCNKDGRLVLEYGYFYDNIPISEYQSVIKIEMSEDRLTGLSIIPLNIESDKNTQQKSFSPSWLTNILMENINDTGVYTISYKYKKISENVLEAKWIPVKIKQ
ncbi:MAG: hypothetical protein U0M06_10305, partial [Clostridia bacterium]|nr:hypothetical protein [Clostridia bacterium]